MTEDVTLENQFQPESITFITTLSACINTLYYVSALGMGIFNASVVGITFLCFIALVVLGIALFVSWIDKMNYANQVNQYNLLKKIEKNLNKTIFPKKILSNLEAIPDRYTWRLGLLLFMCVIADILVSSTLLSTLTYFIFGADILQEFTFQLFLICFSTILSLILCCLRTYNFDTLINNRNKIKNFAKKLLESNSDDQIYMKEKTLNNFDFLLGLFLALITTIAVYFLLNHIFLISQMSIFSLRIINLITMIESYIHGYSLLASSVVGFVVFRIYRSFKLESPDWQLINSFINVVSTYAVVIIFSQRFIVLFVTLFSIPLSAPQIALANFLIPVIASAASIFHAYSFFTFYSDERELNINVTKMEDYIKSDQFPSNDKIDPLPTPGFDDNNPAPLNKLEL